MPPNRGSLAPDSKWVFPCKMLFTRFLPPDCARWTFRFLCSLLVFLFLILSCPKRALVWGNCCERLHVEIFVRVLRLSRVNFNNVNNTNMFCCVWIESPFILVTVAVLNSVLQKQLTSAVSSCIVVVYS